MHQRHEQLRLHFVKIEETLDVWMAARIAKVSVGTIRRWCEEGRIEAYKLVGRWRIPRAAFLDFLRASGARLVE
jgi:excisionase family DNA binding protein